jgi:hypothetical protein
MGRFLALVRGVAVAALAGAIAVLAAGYGWRGVSPADLFWKGIVPLVPLILLTAPQLWRRICPVAAINLAAARVGRSSREIAPPRMTASVNVWFKRYGLIVAAGLLWLLVPMRLLLFNSSAGASLTLILCLGAAALAMGIAGPWKASWCASICPVYPVEKLYGSSPFWVLRDARCVPARSGQNCFRCAWHCMDVPESEAPYRRAMEKAGTAPAAEQARRLFAGSFPGFVAAYWILSAAAPGAHSIFTTYALFALCMAASYALYRAAALFLGKGGDARRRLDLFTTLLALNLYYAAASDGFSTVVTHLAGWSAAQPAFRTAAIALALSASLVWLRRAWHRQEPGWATW